MMHRLGLIGAGRHGRRYLMRENGGRRLVSVLQHKNRPDCPVDWSGEITTDLEKHLRALDGVIIATPPDSHRQYAEAAILAGLPVLVEKPLALTWEDCEAIIDVAEMAGVPLLVGHTHLFASWFEHLLAGTVYDLIDVMIGGSQGEHAYSLQIDWGPHGVAMAIALHGFERPLAWSSSHEYRLWSIHFENASAHVHIGTQRSLNVCARGKELYNGLSIGTATPMARMLDVFSRLIDGSWDRRADYEFARSVYRVLLTESEHGRTSQAIANG